ncbi:hypothetical protein FB451DRAFT_1415599 [Mycena latifolia]|nr:hypothetical protein FB451DRAFT_1415599 [Mycena latifolia]
MAPRAAATGTDLKTQRRQETLARYRQSHLESLNVASRERMARFRSKPIAEEAQEELRARKLASAAAYREKNREKIREADKARRRQVYIKENGLAAWEARELLRKMNGLAAIQEEPPSLQKEKKKKRRKIEPPSDDGADKRAAGGGPSRYTVRERSPCEDYRGIPVVCLLPPVRCRCTRAGKWSARCDECRICYCLAWWCKDEHPSWMKRPGMRQLGELEARVPLY